MEQRHSLGVCLSLPLQQAGLADILNIPSETITSEISTRQHTLMDYESSHSSCKLRSRTPRLESESLQMLNFTERTDERAS